MSELLNFTNRHVVLTGAASGMGAATLRLLLEHGASVSAVDVAPIAVVPIDGPVGAAHVQGAAEVQAFTCDLGDENAIDAFVEGLDRPVDVLLNCAGVPNGGRFDAEAVMRINWLGLRHLTERLLSDMPPGAAVVHVASTAGRNWPDRVEAIQELIGCGTPDEGFGPALDWIQNHPEFVGDGYSFSKEVVQFYTLQRSLETLQLGVRMNSICPGVTNTAIVEDFRRGVGDAVLDRAVAVVGRMADPAEMAPPLLFLADNGASSYINGVNLNVDLGTGAAHLTGSF